MKVKVKLTPARRAALEVMYRAEGSWARESNQTTHADNNGDPCIYWQTRAWLTANGFAVEALKPGWYHLTEPGVELAELVMYGERDR